ncbi:hypothetical protein ACFO0O_04725 [Cobetia amphilecti]|uniref:Uncharacterized protein n=1 Tax=Cobetia amphilecti TaxID=1055104 RepID=A0ABT6UNT4_9GAMM|nr:MULTISPECIES: hypothetical protein [Cobetia]MBR9798346.1 hypothetical protein [Gammaproteobacteria bacterium]KGA02264.1 hypothetical protein KP05_07755 [Cobetia amphilecti]MDI5884365.1 hypothetical protein [Cobetia amphilecti]UBU49085.1 hypothetical protein LCW13_02075 [Cobetia amphilecti]BBO55094.1 hypothetical protein CLAM6_04050 [Cobetia sp. AM6]
MTRSSPWRAALLTLAVMIGGIATGISGMGVSGMGIIQSAHAHALPGSTLIFQQQPQHTLKLTLQFPREDLLIAAPQLAALGDAKPDAPLAQTLTDQLSDYLNQHLALSKDGDALPLTLTEAHLTSTYQPQLGDYLLVVTQWNVKTEQADLDSLLLKYDAVMHEVRNHRAEVEWQTPAGDTRLLADFGFFHSAHGVRLDLRKARQAPAKQE